MEIEVEQVDKTDKEAVQQSMTALQSKYDDRIKFFVDSYENSELKNDPNKVDPDVKPIKSEDVYKQQHTSWFYQFKLIAQRSIRTQIRLPAAGRVKIAATIFVALLCLAIYWDIDEDKAGIQNR